MSELNSPTPNPQPAGDPNGRPTLLSGADGWMAAHPWHPRIAPEMVYLILLTVVVRLQDWNPIVSRSLYLIQCLLVVAILWRYRKLLPELTWSFHWAAIPVGLGVCVIWVVLAETMRGLFPDAFSDPGTNSFELWEDYGGKPATYISLTVRLLGMSIVVPMFEELFNRSLLLRSLSSFRKTGIGVMNLLQDLPVLDDLISETSLAKRAGRHHRTLGDQFEATPLGKLTFFGVMASTVLFMLAHGMRDWPGAIVCGVVYCLLVGYTNRGDRKMGLGPVIWAHGITNAALWVYVVFWGQWHYF